MMGWLQRLFARLRAGAVQSAPVDSGSRPDAVGVRLATDALDEEPPGADTDADEANPS